MHSGFCVSSITKALKNAYLRGQIDGQLLHCYLAVRPVFEYAAQVNQKIFLGGLSSGTTARSTGGSQLMSSK